MMKKHSTKFSGEPPRTVKFQCGNQNPSQRSGTGCTTETAHENKQQTHIADRGSASSKDTEEKAIPIQALEGRSWKEIAIISLNDR